ncbi:MAG: hypothetical protein OH319_04020 [Candidatus Parvarchaeota archaeon]|nr:hypothetical protein [Candidatus Jingweiarchaeum tengchongense]MCW1298047.1 hypothetical protein [Candidatus Jingweiarchaeum tengchongense]MCW1300153.1 hypothetical protein [Candidatus Jingweiarchaeum tengchongense]MCW1304363.1 hypothetical protein [Candidatus Jingweiarchaeum tengchongense]MCW1305917.1 hypothetical protein [Candidatus Jingweiarchaeum tengchongense]
MTGPGIGKLSLKKAKVYIEKENKKVSLDGASVYIHVKGFSLARVTHLDIEHESLNHIVNNGKFLSIHGIKNGLKIKLNDESIVVLHKFLNLILGENEKTRTWVGGKENGVYIGFKKSEIIKLENVAREKFNFKF